MTCGLRKYKASFEQRKTDGEGIRVARKVEELMMSDIGGQSGYGPAVGACRERRGQRGVAGWTGGGQRAGVKEAGVEEASGQRAAKREREREHQDTCETAMSSSQPPPFPTPASDDDARQARRRLARKSFCRRFFPLRHRRLRKEPTIPHIDSDPDTSAIQPIVLGDPLPDSDDDYQDKFAWAVLYENQRGSVLLWHTTSHMLTHLGCPCFLVVIIPIGHYFQWTLLRSHYLPRPFLGRSSRSSRWTIINSQTGHGVGSPRHG